MASKRRIVVAKPATAQEGDTTMNVKARLEKIERQVMAQPPAPDDESTLTPAERYRRMLNERPRYPVTRKGTRTYTPEQAYAAMLGLPVSPEDGEKHGKDLGTAVLDSGLA